MTKIAFEIVFRDPGSLINVLFLDNTVHFGSKVKHVNLRWGDVQQNVTSTGEEYLELIERERATKTNTGVTSESPGFAQKMFENRGTYCQVY